MHIFYVKKLITKKTVNVYNVDLYKKMNYISFVHGFKMRNMKIYRTHHVPQLPQPLQQQPTITTAIINLLQVQ